jgi:hypothetical protein
MGPEEGPCGREGLPVMIGDSRIEGKAGRPPPEQKIKSYRNNIIVKIFVAYLYAHTDDLLGHLTVCQVWARQDFRNDSWEITHPQSCLCLSELY